MLMLKLYWVETSEGFTNMEWHNLPAGFYENVPFGSKVISEVHT
jgi:hypothetical protein